VIEPGKGIGREVKEHHSGVAVATSRGRDAGIVAKAEPGEASVQVTAAVLGPAGFGDDDDITTEYTHPARRRFLRRCVQGRLAAMDPLLVGTGLVIGLATLVTTVANVRAARLARDDLARRREQDAWEARLELVGPGLWRRVDGDRTVTIERESPMLARAAVVLQARTRCRAARRTRVRILRGQGYENQHSTSYLSSDIKLGDAALDPFVLVQGDEPAAVVGLFGAPDVRAFLRTALLTAQPPIRSVGLDDEGVYLCADRDGTDAAVAARAAALALELAVLLDAADAALPPLRLDETALGASGAGGSPFAIR
jgi:hypothetical protein